MTAEGFKNLRFSTPSLLEATIIFLKGKRFFHIISEALGFSTLTKTPLFPTKQVPFLPT